MIRQNTVGEPRLIEIVELHKSLGYEVGLEPVKIDGLDDKCRRCFENEIDEVKTVYVRKKEMDWFLTLVCVYPILVFFSPRTL